MENNSLPLVSVISLSYNNCRFYEDLLSSVFSQTYENIEIVICNDCSEDFDAEEIKKLTLNAPQNIKNIIIHKNETNMGTVKNLNSALSLSSGDYIMCIAADDMIYSENVIKQYINFYIKYMKTDIIAVSKTAMYDNKMENIISYYPRDDGIKKLEEYNSHQLFSELSIHCFFSTSLFLSRKYLEKYGPFDESYRLIEDTPFFLKAFKRNTPVVFMDFISTKHRDGGISHGNIYGTTKSMEYYIKDNITFYENDIIPNKDILTPEAYKNAVTKLREYKFLYFWKFLIKTSSLATIIMTFALNFDIIVRKVFVRIFKIKRGTSE